MIVNNFDVLSVFAFPAETNAPLVIHANAILPGAVSFKRFQPVPGRQLQIKQLARTIYLGQLSQGDAFNLRRQAVIAPSLP